MYVKCLFQLCLRVPLVSPRNVEIQTVLNIYHHTEVLCCLIIKVICLFNIKARLFYCSSGISLPVN